MELTREETLEFKVRVQELSIKAMQIQNLQKEFESTNAELLSFKAKLFKDKGLKDDEYDLDWQAIKLVKKELPKVNTKDRKNGPTG